VLDGGLDLAYSPAVVHGDLAPYHLCFNPAAHRLSGVIDFGNAGLGDPAVDLGSLILAFGEGLLWQIETVYPRMSGLVDRARFYAATFELRWALAAVRSRPGLVPLPPWLRTGRVARRVAGEVGVTRRCGIALTA
jgi:aminoglycoside 2''-phosphotransferase